MKSLSNDLIVLADEIDWARNYLIKNLNEVKDLLKESDIENSLLKISERIEKCLSALEEPLEE